MNLFVLFGQTAAGKTAKAFELIDKENGEIINFDSRQIYKKLDIVTGKDKPKNPRYKIWLYDIVDPKKIFSSAEYVALAKDVLKDILKRGKTPILVGGTGYYLSHLLFGIPEIHVEEDWELRKDLAEKTVEELQKLLQGGSPTLFDSMNESDRSNPRRLIRRIEIMQQGKDLPIRPTTPTLPQELGVEMITLPFFHSTPEAAKAKISLRVDQRITDGALEETQNLLNEGYAKDDPGLQAIGYPQLIAFLNKEKTLEEAKTEWITKEVQYAKRQKTYFKKMFPEKQ